MNTDIGLAVLIAKINQLGSSSGSSGPLAGTLMDFASNAAPPDKWAPCLGETLGRRNYQEAAKAFPYQGFIKSLSRVTVSNTTGETLQMTNEFITTSDGCVLNWDGTNFVKEQVIPSTHKWAAFGCKNFGSSTSVRFALSTSSESTNGKDTIHFWRTVAPNNTTWEEVLYGVGTTWGDSGNGMPYYLSRGRSMAPDPYGNGNESLLFLATTDTYGYPQSIWSWDGVNPPTIKYAPSAENNNWMPTIELLPHSSAICDYNQFRAFNSYNDSVISYKLYDFSHTEMNSPHSPQPYFINENLAVNDSMFFTRDVSKTSPNVMNLDTYPPYTLSVLNDFYYIPYQYTAVAVGGKYSPAGDCAGMAVWKAKFGAWEVSDPLFSSWSEILGIFHNYSHDYYFLLVSCDNPDTQQREQRIYQMVIDISALDKIILPTVPTVNGVQKLVYIGSYTFNQSDNS